MMEHRGYSATITFDADASLFVGRINGIADVVHFEADGARGLELAFHAALDDYLTHCEATGRAPDAPASGKHPLKISPELHRRGRMVAEARGISFNAFATDAVTDAVQSARLEPTRISQDKLDDTPTWTPPASAHRITPPAQTTPTLIEHQAPQAPLDTAALRERVRLALITDETQIVNALTEIAAVPTEADVRIEATAAQMVEEVRSTMADGSGLDAFMQQFDLSSSEGVVLMCMAEALLRIPDAATKDRLIEEKIGNADWDKHLGQSDSMFVNASTWGLMLTGRVINMGDTTKKGWKRELGRLVSRSGEPVIRQSLVQAMRILGRQFVMGRTIDEATQRAKASEARGYLYTYDMLGEAAHTAADAERYFDSYMTAIKGLGQVAKSIDEGPMHAPGISIKLSALHPRYEFGQADRVRKELTHRLLLLAQAAKRADIGLTVDAEEADRLDLSLDVIEAVSADRSLAGWDGFGLAVQAYLKSGLALVNWLADMAKRHDRRLNVRLVKGAYWDTEIKLAQVGGYDQYPVFTRKASTDVSYLACAKRLLASPDVFYPAFATHNAHTIAAILHYAGGVANYEFQRLHGMGEELYDQIIEPSTPGPACRVYAPVGGHEDLLAYLVRRLLENGANTSFVNRIADADAPIAKIVADPVAKTRALTTKPHPRIPLPAQIFEPERRNARGFDLANAIEKNRLLDLISQSVQEPGVAAPIIGGEERLGATTPITDPAQNDRVVGALCEATPADVADALARAQAAQDGWDRTPATERAAILERAADLYETHTPRLMALAIREAGKTIPDAIAEVREAVDFLRYYAGRARIDFGAPEQLTGPTGEANHISLHGRGVFGAIAPWNFPLAIFTGEVAAALAAGNTVLAKPADQTPLIAAAAVRLLHQAGVPGDVLHLLPGRGASVGAAIVRADIDGVVFTGSTATAHTINKTLAAKGGAIVPLIAETGGQNAMIVDSSALTEQVTQDVIASAFQSAGQRCSALRVLFLQDDIADKQITMIKGAMDELRLGDPMELSTDVGPVIDVAARDRLQAHAERMDREAKLIHQLSVPKALHNGTYFAPRAYEIDSLDRLTGEVFGPILHVIRYKASKLDAVIDAVNQTGFGLTLGIHSRIQTTINHVLANTRIGNSYVNRNQIGAVVGVQPFGGEGLSGTGPKAGGPRYLHRFATERTTSINTTAAGGNTTLMSLNED